MYRSSQVVVLVVGLGEEGEEGSVVAVAKGALPALPLSSAAAWAAKLDLRGRAGATAASRGLHDGAARARPA